MTQPRATILYADRSLRETDRIICRRLGTLYRIIGNVQKQGGFPEESSTPQKYARFFRRSPAWSERMNVFGIDFGNANCVVAVARKGGVDIVLNESSNRQTPCAASGVSVREDSRTARG